MHRRPAFGIAAVVAWGLAACAGTHAQMPLRSDNEVPDEPQASDVDDNDAPEISRGVGRPGGVIVLWPRIVHSRNGPSAPDDETRALAARMQRHLASLIHRDLPGVPVDVRPEPERVCPRTGCVAVSVGVLLTRSGQKGCSATALVAPPDVAPARLVPWAGRVEPTQQSVPFREHAEDFVRVRDLARCDTLLEAAADRDKAVVEAIRQALRL